MERRSVALPLLAIAFMVLLVPGFAVAGTRSDQATVHPRVWEMLQYGGETEVLVVFRIQADLSGADELPTKEAKGHHVYKVLRSVAEASQKDLRAILDADGIQYQSFYLVNALRLRADMARVRLLAARSDVARIVPNPWVQGARPLDSISSPAEPGGIEPNLLRVGADDVWALGYTGQGVVVGGQDTGYDWDHPALKGQYRGWDGTAVDHDYNWHDAIHEGGGACGPDVLEPCDDYNHGTHTMGTIVGDDGGANQIGMAPGAEWIGCRNMDVGHGTPATYIECFEFFLAPYPVGGLPQQGDPSLAPHIVSNSWSCPPSEGCDPDTLEAAVDAMRRAGILMVVSAGNEGHAGCGSVKNPPALYLQSFTVGAFDHRTDEIYWRSSRGPVGYNGKVYKKPDIVAPGISVRSSTPNGSYGYNTGTSMAAPHVAGAAALVLSAAPSYIGGVDALEMLLTSSAEPRLDSECGDPGPPNNVWGWGILDALAAVQAAPSGSLQGIVSEMGSGVPIAAARVKAKPMGGGSVQEAWTDAAGRYAVTLGAGSYSVSVEADGYLSQKASGVSIQEEQVTIHDFVLLPAERLYYPLIFRDS